MSEMWYTYWLACVEGITGDRKCELCRKNGSAEAVYYIEEKGIREQIITEKEWGILKESKKKRNWREAYQKAADRGIQMAVRGQNNAVCTLFYRGDATGGNSVGGGGGCQKM